MPRVVLHPGFHKTGTSTTEHTLLSQADMLRDHCGIYGNPQLGDAPQQAKAHSVRRSDQSLSDFATAWKAAVSVLPPDAQAIITCVDLLGRIPGHPRIADYGATPALLSEIVAGLEGHFGQDLDLHIVLSVRAPQPWLKSLWFQNLKVHRVTEDFDAFAERFAAGADLKAQADQLRDAASAWPLHVTALEQSKDHALGPAGPLVDLVDLPDDLRARLVPHAPLKVSFSEDAMAVLLDLNRSDLDARDLRAAKRDAMTLLRRI